MTATELAAYRAPGVERSRPATAVVATLAGIVALAVPVTVVVAIGQSGYDALHRGYPGQLTSLLSTVLRVVVESATWLTVGSLVVLLFLLATPRPRDQIVIAEPEWRLARITSLVWALGAVALAVVDAADANGVPLDRVAEPGAIAYLVEASAQPRAWLVAAGFAFLAFIVIAFGSRWTTMLVAVWASVIALLAPVVVGQILVGPDHDFGSDAGLVQAIVAAVVFGTLIVLGIRRATGRLLRPETLRRTALVVGVGLAVLLLAELALAAFKTVGFAHLATPTGVLIGIRVALLLVVAGVFLAAVLAWRAGTLSDRRIGAVLATAALAGAGYLAATVAMTRIPPPQYFVPTSITQVFLGFDLPAAPDVLVLFTQWRPNVLFATLAVAAVTVYLVALWSATRKGVAWPVMRTVSWLLGWGVVVFATSSGFGKYSGADFGIHMIVHMGLNMLGPVLLCLGGVVTLLLRATTPNRAPAPAGIHEWIVRVMHWPLLRVLTNPLLVFISFVGSYYALYLSPLFEEAVRYHWAHQLMNLHFLIAGYLFYWMVIGVDRPPRPLPPLGKLGFVLAAMPFHAFFGIALMTATTPIAENYYQSLDLPWAHDLMASQYLGGGVAWAGGELPLLLVVIVLGIQWARQDSREAKRRDRHYDTGRDDDFEAYNRMLAELTERRARTGASEPESAPATASAPQEKS